MILAIPTTVWLETNHHAWYSAEKGPRPVPLSSRGDKDRNDNFDTDMLGNLGPEGGGRVDAVCMASSAKKEDAINRHLDLSISPSPGIPVLILAPSRLPVLWFPTSHGSFIFLPKRVSNDSQWPTGNRSFTNAATRPDWPAWLGLFSS